MKIKQYCLLPIFLCFALLSFSQEDQQKSSSQEEIQETQVYKKVEEMPRFPGCEAITDSKKQKDCWQTKMLEFIYGNIQYPKDAKAKGVEGMIVIRFIISADGSLRNYKIVRNLEGGLGEEGLRIAKLMPNWIPGKQNGQPVDVYFNLPIRFRL